MRMGKVSATSGSSRSSARGNKGMQHHRDSIAEISALTQALVLEHRTEEERYRAILEGQPIARRRAEGLSWAPVRVVATGFSVGGRPMVEVEADAGQADAFRTGSAVQLASDDGKGEAVAHRGIVRKARGLTAEVVLDGQDLPEQAAHRSWVLDARFDERSFQEMARALSDVLNAGTDGKPSRLAALREVLLGFARPEPAEPEPFDHPQLNGSQCAAVGHALAAPEVATVHGPPGTGKTTTLVQLVKALVRRGGQVLCCAPSNAAVDLMVERLGAAGIKVVRLGHPMRIDPAVADRSMDRLVEADPDHRQVKAFRRQAEEAAREAEKRFRNFGSDQRAARREALAEARSLRKEADRLEQFLAERVIEGAEVVCCTLVGAADRLLAGRRFGTAVIDEAGQALEPAAWIPIRIADRVVLAGDAAQLPPTVKDEAARKAGLGVSLLEKAIARDRNVHLLDTQYRMHAGIMAFPNARFYGDRLKAHPVVADRTLEGLPPLSFIDTAGRGWEEERSAPEAESTGRSHASIRNPEEAQFIADRVAELRAAHPGASMGVIAPYRAQVTLLEELLHAERAAAQGLLSIQTVDGFQGQERDIMVIGLTRSNDEGTVGFLGEHRRMNVAMTRARQHLMVVGDSATLGNDGFYAAFTAHCESTGAYRSCWEWA